MTRRNYIGPALALWLAVELVAFVVVVQALGLGGAILLGLGGTALGFALLRENFSTAIAQVRGAFSGTTAKARQDAALAEGLVGALGALLLILPGFVSDLVGLALTTPSVRKSIALKVSRADPRPRRDRNRPPGVVDLNPGEWRVSDSSSESGPR